MRPVILSVIMLILSLVGLGVIAATAPAYSQENCATATHRLLEATQLNITADKITVIDDVAFINDYTRDTGLGIPDDSSPKGMLLIEFSAKAYVGLIEQNGCILYETAIPIQVHELALKSATSGV